MHALVRICLFELMGSNTTSCPFDSSKRKGFKYAAYTVPGATQTGYIAGLSSAGTCQINALDSKQLHACQAHKAQGTRRSHALQYTANLTRRSTACVNPVASEDGPT